MMADVGLLSPLKKLSGVGDMMRDRLVYLIGEAVNKCKTRTICHGCKEYGKGESCIDNLIADHLLENRMIVLPCKVGDTVYYIGGIHRRLIKSATVVEIILNSDGVRDLFVNSEDGVSFENSLDTFFFTREEAELALNGEQNNG